MAHTIKGETSPPLTPEEAASIAVDELKTPHPATWEPEAGQPYQLSLLRTLGKATQDRDLALLAYLETGVPTDTITPFPSSFQWPSQDTLDLSDLPPLELCWGNWKAAEEMPDVVKVRPEEHGLLMFRFRGNLYHYVVCHFGGRFSAYWWQRVGAFLLRQCHELLAFAPHKAWLYVDDLLSALHKEHARELFAIMIIFFAAINAPMSWKKAQFAQAINWCGWTVDFELDTIQLIGNKLNKLQGQIDALLKTKKVDRKALEKCIGLLVWATSISNLRPFLACIRSRRQGGNPSGAF